MRLCLCFVIMASLPTMGSSTVLADSTIAIKPIVANAEVRSRTSIVASTEVLRFRVTDPNQPADGMLTFSAGARASASSEVVLVARAGSALESSGGSTSPAIGLTVVSSSAAIVVDAGLPVVVSRWTGGGSRSGELRFQLRAAPGTYTIPVKLELIVP